MSYCQNTDLCCSILSIISFGLHLATHADSAVPCHFNSLHSWELREGLAVSRQVFLNRMSEQLLSGGYSRFATRLVYCSIAVSPGECSNGLRPTCPCMHCRNSVSALMSPNCTQTQKLWNIYGTITAIAAFWRYSIKTQSAGKSFVLHCVVWNWRFLRIRYPPSIAVPTRVPLTTIQEKTGRVSEYQTSTIKRRPNRLCEEDSECQAHVQLAHMEGIRTSTLTTVTRQSHD